MKLQRSTRRREAPRPVAVAAGGLLATLALILVIALALRSPNGLPLVDYRDLTVEIDNPGNLQTHNDVRIHGVRVGQVIDIEKSASGRGSIDLRFDGSIEPLPIDSRVALRGSGLLGARYVEVIPGRSSRTLRDGATLETEGDVLTYGVPDALNTLDERARGSLATGIRELSAGFAGRGPVLNEALADAPLVGADLKRILGAPLQRPGAAERLLPSLRAGIGALDAAAPAIVKGLEPGRRALQPFIDEADALDATLRQAPPTLRQATDGLTRGTRLIAATGALSRAANRTLPPLPAALRTTTTLLRSSPRPLRRTDALLNQLSTAVPPTLDAVSALGPVLTPLRRLADDLNPIVDELAPRGCDVDNFAENWRSMLGFGVPRGERQGHELPSGFVGPLAHLRVTVLVDSESLQGVSQPAAGGFSDTYPAPCLRSPGSIYSQTGLEP